LVESFLEKMEIGESIFGKKHGKLSHGKYIAPKFLYGWNAIKITHGKHTTKKDTI
jgi:hypothetical protein